MKSVLIAVVAIVATGGLTPGVAGPSLERPRFRASLDVGYSTAAGSWATEGYLSDALDFRSELEWEDLESVLTVLSVDVAVVPDRLRVRASYGAADIGGGRNTDTDIFYRYDRNVLVDETVSSRSVSETDGDTEVIVADLLLSCSGAKPLMEGRMLLDAVFGYFRYEDSLTDSRGLQTLSGGQPVNAPFAADGVNAEYAFEWSGLRAGLNLQYAITDRASVAFAALVLFNVEHEGPAFWSLRGDLRAQSPNLTNRAEGGLGTDLSAWLEYALTPHVSLRAGVQAWQVGAEDGDHTLHYADGSNATGDLSEVSSDRQSAFAGVSGQF
jgi:hypothetical protein